MSPTEARDVWERYSQRGGILSWREWQADEAPEDHAAPEDLWTPKAARERYMLLLGADVEGILEEIRTHYEVDMAAALDELEAMDLCISVLSREAVRLRGQRARAHAMLMEMAGGGLGVRTEPSRVCLRCVRLPGLALHDPTCDLAALLKADS